MRQSLSYPGWLGGDELTVRYRAGRILAFACLVLASFGGPTASAFAERKNPNIIVILADDLGYGDLGCFGQKTLPTPRLDAMAKEGMTWARRLARVRIIRGRTDRLERDLSKDHKTMKAMTAKWGAMVLAGLLVCLCKVDAQPPEKNLFRSERPLKTPRSRDPVLGGSRDKVFFSVWVPEGIKTVRGAVCNPFSKDAGVSKHWQAACRHWQFAYLQTDFDAVKKEEFALLKPALAELARKSGHPEIEHVPLCFLGMSRGGGMSMQLAELLPERTLASVPVCLEVGPTSEATRRIPVLTVFGEKDGKQMDRLRERLPPARKEQAHWAIAVQWGRGHEFGQANNLSFVFLDDVIARRLPKESGIEKPAALGPFPLEEGWVGDPSTWGKDGKRPTIRAWKEFQGEADQVCWLPSQRVAAVWQAFVGATRDVTINEPAGLGDGQPFVLQSAAKPVAIKVTIAAKLKPEKVELWDAHLRLAERTEAPWTFEVPLKPGIHALIVIAQEAGQPPRTSRPHTLVVAE